MKKNWSPNSKATITDKIVFGILYSIVYLLSLLPFCIIYLLSDCLYVLVYKIVGYRKKIVKKNLQNSFPEKSEDERLLIEKRFYHFFCDYILETIKLASMSQSTIKQRMQIEGLETILDAVKKQKGVTLYLGHYCNWEWVTSLGLYVPENVFGSQVYHVLEYKPMDMLLLKLRSRMLTVNIPMQETLRCLIRKKQAQQYPVCGFISDQVPVVFDNPEWVQFLNQDTPFLNGTERLTKKLGFAAIYIDLSCVKRGYYKMSMQLMAEDTTNIPDWQLTDDYAHRLEATIRRQPEYWLWTHNRWKRGHEDYFNGKNK